ncbi:hypothetical protein FJW04_23300 [Mesorhizobium sp. B2-7-3]|uniref:hypothetical protein n=1 Tax=Mesorhizobium sp. B2-7-3 TaxID=2589907 RepID=UPI00112B2093|nr:hypothetical protein [Mesorhizobium sp. B2-7-3]TPJ12179.1 hypothetical protein FJW04_23300 [Mesorhizobium sp. B2-7-3]
MALINAASGLPKCKVFTKRFGSIVNAYGLAGFPTTKSEMIAAARQRASARRENKKVAAVSAAKARHP